MVPLGDTKDPLYYYYLSQQNNPSRIHETKYSPNKNTVVYVATIRIQFESIVTAFSVEDSDPIRLPAPIMTPIQRVSFWLSRAIFNIMVNGIDNSIPTGPSTQPQSTKETNTTRGDRLRPRPIHRGSITLPYNEINDYKSNESKTRLKRPKLH